MKVHFCSFGNLFSHEAKQLRKCRFGLW